MTTLTEQRIDYDIGSRIALARKWRRLSLRQLAKKTGLSHTAINNYETNKRTPDSQTLITMAEALGVSLDFFFRATTQSNLQPAYRKRASLTKANEAAVLAEITDWLERYETVLSLLPPEEVVHFKYPANFPYPVSVFEDAETAALNLREAWAMGHNAIGNLTELLEEKGIKVALVDSDLKFDACTFTTPNQVPLIASNMRVSGDRQRFSLAHELGHIMLSPQGNAASIEKMANRFARALLVTADMAHYELGYQRDWLDKDELLSLKHKYGISVAAWIYRAYDLQIISESTLTQLMTWLSTNGWRKTEPGPQLSAEQPQRLNRLVWRLLAEDIISEARAAELLNLTLDDYVAARAQNYATTAV